MKKTTQQSAYQIFEDVIMLAGSFAKLGKTLAANKIQSSAEAASNYVSNVELPDLSTQLSGAKESLGSLSDYAVNTDVKQMIDDVGSFARRHPVTALISVVAVGAMFTQFMRSEPAPTKMMKTAKTSKPKAKAKIAKAAAKPRRKANGSTHAHA